MVRCHAAAAAAAAVAAVAAAAATGKALQEGGIDLLYCSHADGSVSVWQRHARLLTYACLGASRLMPPSLKFSAGRSLLHCFKPSTPCSHHPRTDITSMYYSLLFLQRPPLFP